MGSASGASDPMGGGGLQLRVRGQRAAGAAPHRVRGRAARHAGRVRPRPHHERPLLRRRVCRLMYTIFPP